jgi:hypothetical protein
VFRKNPFMGIKSRDNYESISIGDDYGRRGGDQIAPSYRKESETFSSIWW